ncbi:apovitellenin-1 precursor [Alligator mississippiensis]|uniref:Apovitellenin-1 n=1 Tax=Alligator mississippiensis TaxID=8496 RepID=A0A151MD11_ALLMI|nr:apovitellenin-1 precursor [Alligator mississippiensis]
MGSSQSFYFHAALEPEGETGFCTYCSELVLQTMLLSRAVAIALVMLLSTSFSEVSTKTIEKRHVRRDWLVIPDTIAYYIYESVNKVSPTVGQFLVDAVRMPVIAEIRNLLMKETAKITVMAEQLVEKIKGVWKNGEA